MKYASALGALAAAALFAAPLISAQSHSATGYLLVANKGDQAVGLIDPRAGREIATIKETGFTVHELAASPDGKTLYAPVYGSGGVGTPGTNGRTIDVINLPSRRVVTTIDLGRGLRPHCIKFGPTNGRLYVSTELGDSITIIDPETNKVIGAIPTGQHESHMFDFTPDGSRIYTANVGPGTVSVLDVKDRKTIAVIHVAKTIQRMAVSQDGRWAFTSDQDKPRLAVIDTSTNKIARWIALPGIGYGAAPTPDGRYLLVAIINKDKVAVVDLAHMKVVHVIDVPHAPQEILVRPDGRVAYVSCSQTRKVVAIDLRAWKVTKEIPAGRNVDGMAWAMQGSSREAERYNLSLGGEE
jgi:YVTN family beta-propeller protein